MPLGSLHMRRMKGVPWEPFWRGLGPRCSDRCPCRARDGEMGMPTQRRSPCEMAAQPGAVMSDDQPTGAGPPGILVGLASSGAGDDWETEHPHGLRELQQSRRHNMGPPGQGSLSGLRGPGSEAQGPADPFALGSWPLEPRGTQFHVSRDAGLWPPQETPTSTMRSSHTSCPGLGDRPRPKGQKCETLTGSFLCTELIFLGKDRRGPSPTGGPRPWDPSPVGGETERRHRGRPTRKVRPVLRGPPPSPGHGRGCPPAGPRAEQAANTAEPKIEPVFHTTLVFSFSGIEPCDSDSNSKCDSLMPRTSRQPEAF